jgi:hypothetical protein
MPPLSLARITRARRPSPGRRAPNGFVLARYACNQRLAAAVYCGRSPRSAHHRGARAFHDCRRAAGDTHHIALRALGNRLVGLLHGCLDHHSAYNETIAGAHRTEQKITKAA